MKRFLLSLFILLPGLAAAAPWPELSSPAAEQGGGESDAAVVAGIEKYPFVAQVPGAALNAEDWHLYLTKTRKVPVGQVKLIRDNEATLEDLRDAASWAASNAAPGGTLWFVFIGHGAPHKNGQEGVLIGVDAQQRAESLYNRSLRQGELMDLLSKGRQARTVVVLDACFSGRTADGKELVKGLQPLIAVASPLRSWERAAVFTAAKGDQFAGPLPGAQRPAFSYLLLGALRGWGDADKDGSVTAAEALAFTQSSLEALLKDRRQTPELLGSLAGPLAGPVREPGPDIGSIVRAVRPKDASELMFTEAAPVTLPTIKVSAIQGGFKEADIGVERMLETAVLKEKDPDALPLEKMQSWCALWGTPDNNPYREQAGASCKEWHAFTDKYHEAEINLLDDYATLARYLSLKLKTPEQKSAAINSFMTAYAALKDHPAYGHAEAARDALKTGGPALALSPLDDRGPRPPPKGVEVPPEIEEQAIGPCEGYQCGYQEKCKAGDGRECSSFAMAMNRYGFEQYPRLSAIYMLGCMFGFADACGSAPGYANSTMDTKSAGTIMTVWTHACFALRHLASCDQLGETYGRLKGLSAGEKEAAGAMRTLVHEAACIRGDARACPLAGKNYKMRTPRSLLNFKRAKLLFAKGCRQKNDASCESLSSLKSQMPTLEQDLAKQVEEARKAAEEARQREETGRRISSLRETMKGLEETCEKSESCKSAKTACDKDPKKCFGYSYCFAQGICGAQKDAVFAASILRKACDAGDGGSCNFLAYRHRSGDGVLKDEAQALNLQDKACDLDSASACSSIASDLASGWNGRPKDPSESFRFVKKACALGDSTACANAAEQRLKGDTVMKDDKEALSFARQACEGDDVSSSAFRACVIAMDLGDSKSRKRVLSRCKKSATIAQYYPAECGRAR
ncbi:MAG: caspase family protein [Elusimicrobia bacterium]|nr:caspase family protein [Elusimicrobiota bacterium]